MNEGIAPYTPAWIRAVLAEQGKEIHKGLGQHYLVNLGLVAQIAKAVADRAAGRPVVEIGCGLGVLTSALLDRGLSVTGIEIEEDSARVLEETLHEKSGFRLRKADFLACPLEELPAEPFFLTGNLPYNLSSQILLRTVEELRPFHGGAVFMTQREVAERIASPCGSRSYGVLSALLQPWYDIKILFRVAPGSFLPPPKVDSAVFALTPRKEDPGIRNWTRYKSFVKAGFNQRRKTLAAAFRQAVVGELSPEEYGTGLSKHPELAGRRAEELDWEKWRLLAD